MTAIVSAGLAPSVLAVSFASLLAAHQVGDHWVQTHSQALAKGGVGWKARRACAAHVVVLALVKAVALAVAFGVAGLPVRPVWAVAALGADAASHYWADRRSTLRALAGRLGKSGFFDLGAPRPGRDDNPSLGTGAYALDQAWHIGWLFIAALILTGGAR